MDFNQKPSLFVTSVASFISWSLVLVTVRVQIVGLILLQSFIMQLTIMQNQEIMTISFHLVEANVIPSKPWKYLLTAACVYAIDALHKKLVVPWGSFARVFMLLSMPLVNNIVLYLWKLGNFWSLLSKLTSYIMYICVTIRI